MVNVCPLVATYRNNQEMEGETHRQYTFKTNLIISFIVTGSLAFVS